LALAKWSRLFYFRPIDRLWSTLSLHYWTLYNLQFTIYNFQKTTER
jgi:hypothetical protein